METERDLRNMSLRHHLSGTKCSLSVRDMRLAQPFVGRKAVRSPSLSSTLVIFLFVSFFFCFPGFPFLIEFTLRLFRVIVEFRLYSHSQPQSRSCFLICFSQHTQFLNARSTCTCFLRILLSGFKLGGKY